MKGKVTILVIVLVFLAIGSIQHGQAQGQFVGSKNSDVYHYPSCQYAKQIKPQNQVWFSSASDALSHGYRPCSVCSPPIPELTAPSTCIILISVSGAVSVLIVKRKSFLRIFV
jgi:hypothetical protein